MIAPTQFHNNETHHKPVHRQLTTPFGEQLAHSPGGYELVSDFNYDLLDGHEEDPRDTHYGNIGEAFVEILNWCWLHDSGSVRSPKSAMLRFVALTAAVRPATLDSKTFKALGEEWECTRANISYLVQRVQDRFGFKSMRTRPDSARATFSAAQLGNSNRLGTGKGRAKRVRRAYKAPEQAQPTMSRPTDSAAAPGKPGGKAATPYESYQSQPPTYQVTKRASVLNDPKFQTLIRL